MEPSVVKERLLLLGEYIEDLEDLSPVALEDLLANKRDKRYLERTLQRTGP